MTLLTENTTFMEHYHGYFTGIMRWPDLALFWQSLLGHNDGKWFVYTTAEDLPLKPLTSDDFSQFIAYADELLRSQHQQSYCGIVYVDDLTSPSFIKVYDPKNLGVSCGYSDNPPLPKWVISRLPPVKLEDATKIPSRWKKLLHRFV